MSTNTRLCLHEKIAMISHTHQMKLLNIRSGICFDVCISECRHQNNYLLSDILNGYKIPTNTAKEKPFAL